MTQKRCADEREGENTVSCENRATLWSHSIVGPYFHSASKMSFVAESERRPNHTHVLLITTGSVASIKAPMIVKELRSVRQTGYLRSVYDTTDNQYRNVLVEVVATKSSLAFYNKEEVQRVWTDEDEWTVRSIYDCCW